MKNWIILNKINRLSIDKIILAAITTALIKVSCDNSKVWWIQHISVVLIFSKFCAIFN